MWQSWPHAPLGTRKGAISAVGSEEGPYGPRLVRKGVLGSEDRTAWALHLLQPISS